MDDNPVIPSAWENLDLARLRGILMILGGPDLGKSTLALYLYRQLSGLIPRAGYLDGDPGQSTLGPPGTMTLMLTEGGESPNTRRDRILRSFVGALSPRGHMLSILVSASRLAAAAFAEGADALVYDTSGFVSPMAGGTHLKQAEIDLLRPSCVIAIQREQELEFLLAPLRRSRRLRIIDLPPPPQARRRDVSVRRAHRAAQFARYFARPSRVEVDGSELAVFPAPDFDLHRLVALENPAGFALGLGIIVGVRGTTVKLLTPLDSLDGVDALHLGNLIVNPETYEDKFAPVNPK